MNLLARIGAAFASEAAPSLAQWQALYLEATGETCRRENRIRHALQRHLTFHSAPMAAPSTTHRFKKAFADQKFNYEDAGQTRSITAHSLTNEDVAVLAAYAPHLIEPLPKAEGEEAPDLSKLKKDELAERYAKALGHAPDGKLTKEELIVAIEAATPA